MPGEDAGAVAGFEDELGLGLSDDAVHGDVLKDEVAQGLGALGGHVEAGLGGGVGAGNCVSLCGLGIFMDQAAEPVPPQNPDIRA